MSAITLNRPADGIKTGDVVVAQFGARMLQAGMVVEVGSWPQWMHRLPLWMRRLIRWAAGNFDKRIGPQVFTIARISE